ncbi:helix-turn-helix transcriptional regulator [Renibacterium salmoninarum]|nr:helix-turn-helix transcriptional regulator [Renibacterium salmoninarum]
MKPQGSANPARIELGQFLRDRRSRLLPFNVGLPGSGRRRTPGLRREEVAQLANVGVTWYTWLEQGRNINASEQVLNALADALQLNADEQRHIFTLAGLNKVVRPVECLDVTAHHLAVIEKMLPYPCTIQNGKYDVLAWNRVYRFLISDIEEQPELRRNCLLAAFGEPDWERAYGDRYEEVCRSMVARFRANTARHLGEQGWAEFVDRLKAMSPLFTRLWDSQQVQRTDELIKIFNNPRVGVLRLQFTTLWIDQQRDVRMVTVTPGDDLTAARLAELDRLIAAEPKTSRRDADVAA